MIAVCLVALALPIAGVLVTVHSLTRGASQQGTNSPEPTGSEALESVLKGIADEKLAPADLRDGSNDNRARLRRTWKERGGVSKRLLKSCGGVAIPTSESESEIRLLARIPQDRLAEFRRSVLWGKNATIRLEVLWRL